MMKILMLGAGGVGGYFGGRLVQAGADVTFLVREGRAAQLRGGLRIESPNGDATIPVKVITADAPKAEFDVIILSCKAYGLTGALEAIAPFVREGVAILPLLNGFGHLKQIEARFPDAIVWGVSLALLRRLRRTAWFARCSPFRPSERACARDGPMDRRLSKVWWRR